MRNEFELNPFSHQKISYFWMGLLLGFNGSIIKEINAFIFTLKMKVAMNERSIQRNSGKNKRKHLLIQNIEKGESSGIQKPRKQRIREE